MVAVLVLNAIPLARPASATGPNIAIGLTTYDASASDHCYSDSGTAHSGTPTCINDGIVGSSGDSWFPGSTFECTGACSFYAGYADNATLGAVVDEVKVTFKYQHPGHFHVRCNATGGGVTGGTDLSGAVSYPAAYTTADVHLSASCDLRLYPLIVYNDGNIGTGKAWGVNEIELYGPVNTSCNRYVSDFVHTVVFGVHSFQWKWISSFTGSWSFLRHDGTLTSVSVGTGTDPATFTDLLPWHLYDLVVGDATANGQAPWVLSVNDTGTGFACSFSVADGDQGVLIPPLDAPTLTGVRACYNTTGHLCPAPLTGVNGEVLVTYTLGGGAWASVEIGPAGPLTGCGSYPTLYGPLELDAGTYTTSGLTADPTVDAPSWAVHAFNNAGEACAYATVDYSDPGKVVEVPDPVNPATHTCSITDFACELTNLFSVAENALVGPVRAAVTGVQNLMLAKQPFNYIVRAFNGVSQQLGRASDAVTSTTNCPGVTFTVPMPSAYWPSGVSLPEWTVLKCADFEPLVSTTTYQTIRGVMDAGIYLFWGWAELRALRPRFVAAA